MKILNASNAKRKFGEVLINAQHGPVGIYLNDLETRAQLLADIPIWESNENHSLRGYSAFLIKTISCIIYVAPTGLRLCKYFTRIWIR